MSLSRDPKLPFERKLRLVSAAGVELPAELTALTERLRQWEKHATREHMVGRLADAIIAADDSSDTAMMFAAALAESGHSTAHRSETIDFVRAAVNSEIRAIYSRSAEKIYSTLAARYDSAAAELTAAITVADPDADPATLVTAPEKVRRAWSSAAEHASALTKLLPALHAAGSLARYVGDDPDEALALCVDVTGHDRTQLWLAWDAEKLDSVAARRAADHGPFTVAAAPARRTGRWGALIGMGATLRAAQPPIERYPRKAPVEPPRQVEIFT